MMIKQTNYSLQLNLVIKSCISICITALFTLSMFSPINLALSIKTPEDQHWNENTGIDTITGPVIQTISNIGNLPPHQASKTFAETAIPSAPPPPSSSSNDPTNLTTRKPAVTKMLPERVLIGDEESEKPFNPSPLNITIGSTIVWINSDVETHTVTSDSPDNSATKGREFDSGNLNPNQSFEHTFNKAGTYNYFCIIHPSMTGVINVR